MKFSFYMKGTHLDAFIIASLEKDVIRLLID